MDLLFASRECAHPQLSVFEGEFGGLTDSPEDADRYLVLADAFGAEHGTIGPLPSVHPDEIAPLLSRVHDPGYVRFAQRVLEPDSGIPPFPDSFPYRRSIPDMADLSDGTRAAGWYATDTQTPWHPGSVRAAFAAVAAGVEAARRIVDGRNPALLAVLRPPGHHAGRDYAGGFCYLNTAAAAARCIAELVPGKQVLILDVDFHHGNGTQDIVDNAPEASDPGIRPVHYCSLHADTRIAYPFYGGLADGPHTTNVPLPLQTGIAAYRRAMRTALERVPAPDFVVVSYGTDCLHSDPVGGMELSAEDFRVIGEDIAEIGVPVLAILEGGYDRAGLVSATTQFRDAFRYTLDSQ